MGHKLAIKGHPTRGNEVIKLLEILGGTINKKILSTAIIGDVLNPHVYFFDPDSSDNRIVWYYLLGLEHDGRASEMMIFTLEEFLEKYPFKVGDKVFLYDNITEGYVTGMKWDEDEKTVKYCVYTSSECWCDVKELLKWNNVDLVERHYEEQCEEMVKDNFEIKMQTKRDIDKTMFMLGHTLVPNKVNDKLEYEINDGYEFDRVEKGKIILKPIKPKYPTTYEECCKILNIRWEKNYAQGYKCNLINKFQELFIARNTYYKIAGEEIGLDKPWEPDWENLSTNHHFIKISKGCFTYSSRLLVFPTEEMRDAFYENFKDLIEQCKELL